MLEAFESSEGGRERERGLGDCEEEEVQVFELHVVLAKEVLSSLGGAGPVAALLLRV